MKTLYKIPISLNFLSPGDKKFFLCWIQQIPVLTYDEGKEYSYLVLSRRTINSDYLRTIVALFFRYKLTMTELRIFQTKKNKTWFCDPEKYWHQPVFQHTGKDSA